MLLPQFAGFKLIQRCAKQPHFLVGYRPVVNKAVYMAVGVDMEGIKHILGLWVSTNEGAAFWSQVCAEIANRGVNDVFIVCCDGLKGAFPKQSKQPGQIQ